MGQKKNKIAARTLSRPLSRRRGYMPEPCEDITRANNQIYQVGYFHEVRDRNKHRGHRETNKSFNFTHTSCIMAIRNYVERMNSKQTKRRSIPHKDNAEKLICSLKNDIQTISKYEEEAACNPGKQPTSDPLFVLSAMMCKINKLESILLTQPDCREQMARRRDMITMARCIKKTILEQAQCDEQLLHEKQRRMVCLIKTLDMFERDIRCATRGIKKLCCPQPVMRGGDSGNCSCIDKEKCAKECPGKKCLTKEERKPKSRSPSPQRYLKEDPCKDPCKDPCAPDICKDPCTIDICKDPCIVEPIKKYDITGLKVTYTKSHLQKDFHGVERDQVKNQVSCEVNEDEKCKVTVIKDGKTTSLEECNPMVKQKMTNLSKLWMESARQLIDSCSLC